MHRISFSLYRERARRVVEAQRAAFSWTGPTAAFLGGEGRPLPDDLAVLLIHALESHGPACGPLSLADEWLDHISGHRHEYGVALENLRLGIGPPTSGLFNNDAYGECAGGLALAGTWGLVHPGDPAEAASRAAESARISHFGSAVEAARFLAAAVAETFTTTDLRSCLRAGQSQVGTASRTASCVEAALAASGRGRDWPRTWAAVSADWGRPEPTDALVNLAGSTVALAVGEMSWKKTLDVVRATGGDVSIQAHVCATMLGALGVDVTPDRSKGRATAPRRGGLAGIELPGDGDFAERLCRLAVACARPGKVEITGAPYAPLPGPSVTGPVQMFARYEGEPVLAPGEERAVFLERGRTTPVGTAASVALGGGGGGGEPPEDIPGTLVVQSGERLQAKVLGGVVVPGKIAARAVNVTLAGSPGRPGVVHAEISRAGRTTAVARFGFRRASRYVAMGPFDNLDGKGLQRAYLPESRLHERLPSGRVPFHRKILRVPGDLVDVDGAFGSVGPRVIYLLRVVHSPRARAVSLRIGSSDGIKLWLDGRRLLSDHTHRYGSPDDYVVPAKLRKGPNRIVVKLARCGRTSVFRLRITERDSEEAVLDLWDQF